MTTTILGQASRDNSENAKAVAGIELKYKEKSGWDYDKNDLGFTKIILPYHNLKAVKCDGAELIGVKNIRQAFEAVSI